MIERIGRPQFRTIEVPIVPGERSALKKILVGLARAVRYLWLQIGLTLALLLVIEVSGRAYRHVTYIPRPNYYLLGPGDPSLRPAWSAEYHRELDNMFSQLLWRPYVYWANRAYHGEYINVNSHGNRRTWNQTATAGASRAIKILVFGGSTTFGFGARDDYTIPSVLAEDIAQSTPRYDVRIINEGTVGYVSTQEVITLIQLLRSGEAPDLVIFYDGINDTEAAFEDGTAGATEREGNRAAEFNILNPDNPCRLFRAALGSMVMHSIPARIAKNLIAKLAPSEYQLARDRLVSITARSHRARELDAPLAADVVSMYLGNKRCVEAIAEKVGFRCLFFWQPVIYVKRFRTPYEETAEQSYLPGAESFFRTVYLTMTSAAANNGVHDLSGVFNDTRKGYFIDSEHIDEAGNEVVAHAMLPEVMRVLAQIKEGRR